jgi:LmbE family N-acetylglucosaminyl deacetylase
LKYCIVTAHPDDEVLWCGGLPSRYKGDWTIICCSIPVRDPIRAYKFFEACEVLGVKAKLLPYTETNPHRLNLEGLDLEEYDHIVTHNQWGEYGHIHHAYLHNFIKETYSHKNLTFIGYRPHGEGEIQIRLTPEELETKMNALKKYDHCLPYEGRNIPKWEALLHRYCTTGGLDLAIETYDGAAF